MAHNIVDWQTRSEALVALIDDTMALRHIMWIDPGEDSGGIAAHGGDTFAVANEQGRLLYEHTMPVKHARSSTERHALKLLNLGCELDASMRLMRLLDFHSQDLLEDLNFSEKQVRR